MWVYVALYVGGMLVGLAANVALDVQMHRPGARQAIGLVVFVLLLWGASSLTRAPLGDFLLPIIWLGTGLLAGLGSREMHAAPA